MLLMFTFLTIICVVRWGWIRWLEGSTGSGGVNNDIRPYSILLMLEITSIYDK